MKYCKNILFTGLPGCGKTTIVSKIVSGLEADATGFITYEIREKGRRTGFSIDTLDGKRALMAHVNIRSKYKVGKYGVDLSNIDNIAVPSIIPNNPEQTVIIDEIGKMECFSKLFMETLENTLDSGNTVIGTISLKGDRFIRQIKERNDVTIITVNKKNRNDLAELYFEKQKKRTL